MATSQKPFRMKGSYLTYVLIYFFSYFAMASFSAVLSVYLTGIGKTASEMSFIISGASLFSFAMVPLVGYLCDRLKKSRLISGVLLMGMGVMAVVFAVCRQVWALFLLNGLIMSFYNSTMPISERLAASCKYRYGVLRVWGTFGYAAGAQAAGLAIQSLPPITLFAMVCGSALLAAVGFAGAEDPRLPPAEEENREVKPARLAAFLKNPSFLLYLLISFVCAGCSGVNMTYAPMLLNELGVPTGAVGTVLFFSTLVEIPLILFSNKFMDRFSGKTLLAANFCVFIAQYLFYGLAGSAWVVVTAMVLLKAIASTLLMMIILKIVRNLVAPELTTTGLSIVNSINNLGTIVLQNLGGALVDRASVQTLYLYMAAAAAAGLVLSLFLKVKNNEKVFG